MERYCRIARSTCLPRHSIVRGHTRCQQKLLSDSYLPSLPRPSATSANNKQTARKIISLHFLANSPELSPRTGRHTAPPDSYSLGVVDLYTLSGSQVRLNVGVSKARGHKREGIHYTCHKCQTLHLAYLIAHHTKTQSTKKTYFVAQTLTPVWELKIAGPLADNIATCRLVSRASMQKSMYEEEG